MPDHSPSLFGSDFPGVTEIDFMMHALIRNVEDVAPALHVFVHKCDSNRLVIIRTDMHALDA